MKTELADADTWCLKKSEAYGLIGINNVKFMIYYFFFYTYFLVQLF